MRDDFRPPPGEQAIERLQVWEDRIDQSLAVVSGYNGSSVNAIRLDGEQLTMPAIAFRACFTPTGAVIGDGGPDGPPSLAVQAARRKCSQMSNEWVRDLLAAAERRGYHDLAQVARQELALRGLSEAA
jgi:hypothetical protein